MADEAYLHSILDIVEQARKEGDKATEQAALAKYHRAAKPPMTNRSGAGSYAQPESTERVNNQTAARNTMAPVRSLARLANETFVQPATRGAAGLTSLVTGGNSADRDAARNRAGELTQFASNPSTEVLEEPILEGVGRVGGAVMATPAARLTRAAGRALPEPVKKVGGEVLKTAGDVLGLVPVLGTAMQSGRGLARAAMRYTPEAVAGRKATAIAREAAGENLPAITRDLVNADPSLSAAQATAGVQQPTWQALGEFAKANDKSGDYYRQARAQAGQRADDLARETPDLKQAEAARDAAADPLYAKAKEGHVVLEPGTTTTRLVETMPPSVLKAAEARARLANDEVFVRDQLGNPVALKGTSVQYIKKALDDLSYAGPAATGAERSDAAVVLAYKRQFLAAVDEQIPAFGQARDAYRKASPPVNQSLVMKELQDNLEANTGAESASPFLTGVNKAPDRVLKRATGNPRFPGQTLDDVLTPEQLAAVDKVSEALRRDDVVTRQARAGSGGLHRTLNEHGAGARIPAFFSRVTTAANKGLELAEMKINRRMLDKLVEGMKDGKSAEALLRGMPPEQKVALAKYLNSVTLGTAAASNAALTQREE